MSLRRRLTLLSALAVALAVAIASVAIYALVREQLRGQVDDTLRERAAAAAVVAGERPPASAGQTGAAGGQGSAGAAGGPGSAGPAAPAGGDGAAGPAPRGAPPPPPGGEDLRLPAPPLGGFVPVGQLVAADGTVIRPPRGIRGDGGALPVSDETLAVAAGERGAFFSDVSVDGAEVRVYTVPAAEGTALQIGRPLAEVNDTLGQLRLILVLVSLGSVLLAGLLGLLVARGALAPAAAVSGAAQDVARTGDLTRRIEVRGDDELARLAASFNQMMDSLERSEAARRQLVADASHELRTPLATLRTNIETLGRGDVGEAERGRIISDLEAELEDMGGLVSDIVELARDPAEGGAVSEEVRLDEVAAGAVERARRRGRGLSFREELSPTVVRGDPARLDRAIWNLLDNAIKWSPKGGEVTVSVADGRVSVRDRGPGFSDKDLPHAFDRFYRSDEARGTPGSGLGLAIVRQIARQHGGTAAAGNAEGGGALVTIALPAL